GSQLRDTECRARAKGTKVRSGPTPRAGSMQGLFSYPDLEVICGDPRYHDTHQDVVLNPKVIVEVLSESTEAFDRGEKFLRYQVWNPTLSDYVLVAQASPVVEHFSRREDGEWSYHPYVGLAEELNIESIGCRLRLSDVYERVDFGPEENN